MKKAVGGKTRVDLAVDQIIQVILDRDMKAGDKLPNEYDLARELGVPATCHAGDSQGPDTVKTRSISA